MLRCVLNCNQYSEHLKRLMHSNDKIASCVAVAILSFVILFSLHFLFILLFCCSVLSIHRYRPTNIVIVIPLDFYYIERISKSIKIVTSLRCPFTSQNDEKLIYLLLVLLLLLLEMRDRETEANTK